MSEMVELGGCVALDLEIVHAIEKGGPYSFGRPWELCVSVGCAYNVKDGFKDWFGGPSRVGNPDMGALVSYLDNFGMVITFNGARFDLRVLDGHVAIGNDEPPPLVATMLAGRHVDMMLDYQDAVGKRCSLGHMAQSTLGESKVEDGANAPQMWADNLRLEVITYCRDDTLKTWKIFEYGLEHGYVKAYGKTINVIWRGRDP